MNKQTVRAAIVCANVSFVEIRQVSVRCELRKSEFKSLHANVETFLEWARESDLLHCQVSTGLKITDSEDPVEVLNANVTYRASYLLANHLDVTDDDLEAFTKVSATFSLHPYIREALQNLTVRAGLPPFTLRILKSPLDSDAASAALRASRHSQKSKTQVKSPAKRAVSKPRILKKSE